MSNQQDTVPKVGEVWHSGVHGDGTCHRWRCASIQEPTNFQPRTFVMRALKHLSEDMEPSIAPKGVPESDFNSARSDWHGPETADEAANDSDGLMFGDLLSAVFGTALNMAFGKKGPAHVRPLIIPKGIDGASASTFLSDVSQHFLDIMSKDGGGLEAAEKAWLAMQGTPAMVKEASAEAYADGFAAGTDAGHDKGREVGRAEIVRERSMHPLYSAIDRLLSESTPPQFDPRILIVGRDGYAFALLTPYEGKLGPTWNQSGPMPADAIDTLLIEALSSRGVGFRHMLKCFPRGIGPTQDISGQVVAGVADPDVWFPEGSIPGVNGAPIEGVVLQGGKPGDLVRVAFGLDNPPAVEAYGGHPKPEMQELRAAVRLLMRYSHGNSVASGWWPELTDGVSGRVGKYTENGQRNFGELISLIHSEISEALEGYRKNKADEHLPEYLSVTVELADALHRIFDLAGAMCLSLAEAYVQKGEYNLVRPDHKKEAREAKGGKTF